MTDPRQTRAWRKLRAQVIQEEPVCWLRIATICTHWSQTADHIIPVTERPDLALERANVHGACTACNEARGHLPIAALVRGEKSSDALEFF